MARCSGRRVLWCRWLVARSKKAGFFVAAGIDVDEQCHYPFEFNNNAKFILRDIQKLEPNELNDLFGSGQRRILVGCAPCQAFSAYNQRKLDPSWRLVERFGRLVAATRPDIVSMENVPRLVKYNGGKVFSSLVSKLEEAGYHVSHEIVYLPNYGLAQRRSRLVVTASRHGKLELERPTYSEDRYRTVEQAIGDLRPLAAGEADSQDPLHAASRLSPLNLKRIRASMPGGSWADWEEELVANCHRAETGRGYKVCLWQDEVR